MKYSSILTAIATTNRRLRIFPTPKYIKAKNKDREVEIINPLRELPRSKEKVKRKLTKLRIKKRGTMRNASGFIK